MKPEVRLVQDQQIEINENPNIDSWEAEQLLRKYGYSENNNDVLSNNDTNSEGLSFEEMIAIEERKRKEEEIRRRQAIEGPHPVTFDGKNGYSTETRYGTDEDTGYGFKVQITSDMPLPKY
jgi:hypothetical protein